MKLCSGQGSWPRQALQEVADIIDNELVEEAVTTKTKTGCQKHPSMGPSLGSGRNRAFSNAVGLGVFHPVVGQEIVH